MLGRGKGELHDLQSKTVIMKLEKYLNINTLG